MHVAACDLFEAGCWRVVSAAGKLTHRELLGPGSKENATVSFHQQRGGAVFLDKHLSLSPLVHILGVQREGAAAFE